MARFFVTTPIYYVNGLPHIGAAYTSITADVLARYHRMLGEEVRFLMGLDENAQKNVEAALALPEFSGVKNTRAAVQKYVDQMAAKWQEAWDELGLTNDDFIRTTEKRHLQYVEQFWKRCFAKGDIYLGTYEGLYCTGCESYKTEAELIDGLCPDHKRVPEILREENYFFRLSKYRDALLKHIAEHPELVQPEARRNEIVAYIRDHADDFSISRKNLEWGIPVPGDPAQTIYVWFDALINYVSAEPKWWPANLQIVGKDIIKFHCAYWPAMLLSADLPLPQAVFAHGFFTIDGQKMSKTLGNVVDPVAVAQKYGNDVLRYYLFRDIAFGEDGDFSEARLQEHYNGELANGLGNLVARVLAMIDKYANGKIPNYTNHMHAYKEHWQKYQAHMEKFELDRALNTIWHCIGELDRSIGHEQPWKLAKHDKTRLLEVLYQLGECLRHIAWALLPFMPDTAQKIFDQLGVGADELKRPFEEAKRWGGLKSGTKIKRGEALFPRLT